MLHVLLLLIFAYLLLVLVAAIFQRRLIYFPTKIPVNFIKQLAAERGFVPWTNSSGQIIGWQMAASTTPTACVLILHGNAGSAIDRDYLAQPIHDAVAAKIYVMEYPGYGARAGSPNKDSFNAAAEEAFQSLPKNLPKYVVSESLGTGVACEIAKRHPDEIRGLALLAPYDNLASVAQKQMPLLPAYFLLLDRFSPTECLKAYQGPVKVVLAGKDEILGAASGRRLFDGYAGLKEVQEFPQAKHNEITEQSPEWWREVFAFWQSAPSNREK